MIRIDSIRISIIVLFLLLAEGVHGQQQQTPFYANRNLEQGALDNIQFSAYKGPPKGNEVTDVDARSIIAPIMSPFVRMFDMMQENARAKAYAEKIQRERDDSPFSNSKGLFDLLEKMQRPTTTTTPSPPLMQQLLQPYWEPWQRQLDSISKEMAGITLLPPTTTQAPTTTTQRSLLERSLDMFFPSLRASPSPPSAPVASKEIRRSPPSRSLLDPEVFDKFFEAFDPRKMRQKRHSIPLHVSRVKRQLPELKLPDFPTVAPIPDFLSMNGLQDALAPPQLIPQPQAPAAIEAPKPKEPELPNIFDSLNPLKPNKLLEELSKPVFIGNPFTPNPLMGMFTTKKPIPELKIPEPPKTDPVDLRKNRVEPEFKLQDPFYNPLFPNRKSKIFDLFSGGEAARMLGK